MKIAPGSVGFDKKRKQWFALVTFTENGKRKYRRKYADNKTHARKRLDQLRDSLRTAQPELMTFAALADNFAKARLIEAKYIGEKKVAGRRELSAPRAWLARLTAHFGAYSLTKITPAEIEAYKLKLINLPTKSGQRSIATINRELEFLRTVLNHAVALGCLVKNPFSSTTKKIIEKSGENKRERLLGFGEEIALLQQCEKERAHLRAIILLAVDTGLRRNELFTLDWSDLDFGKKVITVRAFNAKSNKRREIPLTARIIETFQPHATKGLVFEGLRAIKRSWTTVKLRAGIEDLHFHDLRHAFVSRAILAGIPPAFVLKASGHASDEWKRYLNVTPEALRVLLAPVGEQTGEQVKAYAREVMLGLRAALRFDEIEELLR